MLANSRVAGNFKTVASAACSDEIKASCDFTATVNKFQDAYALAAAAVVSEYGGGYVKAIGPSFSFDAPIAGVTKVGLKGDGPGTEITQVGSGFNAVEVTAKTDLVFEDFYLNALNNTVNDKCFNLFNTVGVYLNRVKVRSNGFVCFPDAGPASITARIHIEDPDWEGRGFNDVLGGGIQNSTSGARLHDVHVRGGYIGHDVSESGGSYLTAVGMTGLWDSSFDGLTTYGNLETAVEQYPQTKLKYLGCTVNRAKGSTQNAELRVQMGGGGAATVPNEAIIIDHCIVIEGSISLVGEAGQKVRDFTINGNIVKTTPIQNAFSIIHGDGGVLSNNVGTNATACYFFEQSANIAVNGNYGADSLYGMRDIASSPTIDGTGNRFRNITIAEYVGGGNWGRAYGVGDIYISTVAGNPAARLGYGTWAPYSDGRTLTGLMWKRNA